MNHHFGVPIRNDRMIVSSDDYLHSRAGAVLAVERHYSIMLRPHWRFVSEQYTFLRISQKSSFLRLLAVLPIAFVSVYSAAHSGLLL